MPSSWTPSLRFELQFTGENINLWGDKLNAVLQHADYAVAGFLTKALTESPTTLTTANAGDDEARAAMLKFTGTGAFTVTVPSVSKSYLIWNTCSGVVTLTTGAGAEVAVDPGDIVTVFCDAAGVRTPGYGGLSTKDYISAVALGATGALPGVTGNAGRFVFTDGVSSFWKTVNTTDLGDYAAKVLGVQVALAVAL